MRFVLRAFYEQLWCTTLLPDRRHLTNVLTIHNRQTTLMMRCHLNAALTAKTSHIDTMDTMINKQTGSLGAKI